MIFINKLIYSTNLSLQFSPQNKHKVCAGWMLFTLQIFLSLSHYSVICPVLYYHTTSLGDMQNYLRTIAKIFNIIYIYIYICVCVWVCVCMCTIYVYHILDYKLNMYDEFFIFGRCELLTETPTPHHCIKKLITFPPWQGLDYTNWILCRAVRSPLPRKKKWPWYDTKLHLVVRLSFWNSWVP